MINEYTHHWDQKFKSREWGRYPPEDLVRFMGRRFKSCDRSKMSVLEVGCGPGANLWYLEKEGYQVSGIDCSSTAIDLAYARLRDESKGKIALEPDLRVGDFSVLPWKSESFDVVIDIFSIYANPLSTIKKTISEIYRVLKPQGVGYSKFWGCQTTGYGSGIELEKNTYSEVVNGPGADMGVIHFFTEEEVKDIFSLFDGIVLDRVFRTDVLKGHQIEEFICQFKKT